MEKWPKAEQAEKSNSLFSLALKLGGRQYKLDIHDGSKPFAASIDAGKKSAEVSLSQGLLENVGDGLGLAKLKLEYPEAYADFMQGTGGNFGPTEAFKEWLMQHNARKRAALAARRRKEGQVS